MLFLIIKKKEGGSNCLFKLWKIEADASLKKHKLFFYILTILTNNWRYTLQTCIKKTQNSLCPKINIIYSFLDLKVPEFQKLAYQLFKSDGSK